jgi:hypothetical protein
MSELDAMWFVLGALFAVVLGLVIKVVFGL